MIAHSAARMDRWLVTSPADILSIHLSIDDYLSSVLMGLAVYSWIHFGAFPATVPAAVMASVYAALLFLIFRRILPIALTAHAVDMLRYRYAFLALCAAGVLVVIASPAFRASFGTVNAFSVSRILSLVTMAFMIRYFSRGRRIFLLGACFLVGALATQGAIAVVTLLAIAVIIVYVRFKLARFDFAFSAAGLFGGGYVGEMRGLGQRLVAAARVRVFCVLVAVLGFLSALLSRTTVLHHPFPGLAGLREMAVSAADELGVLVTGQVGLFALVAGVAMFLALAMSRRATDTRCYLSSGLMILYAILFALPFLRLTGLLRKLPPFCGHPMTETFLVPDGLLAGVLVVSGTVFLIELCCRELGALEKPEREDIDDEIGPRSPGGLRRSLRALVAFVYSAAVLCAVVWLVA